MPKRLGYTNDALADLAAISASIRKLRDNPCLYATGGFPGVRELPCEGGYRVLYRAIADTGRTETTGDIRMLHVFGPAGSKRYLTFRVLAILHATRHTLTGYFKLSLCL